MSWLKRQVVMLPTDEKALNGNEYWQPHHLYLLSDEKIEEGDWVYSDLTKNIKQITNVRTECGNNKGFPYKKIITTTDSFLSEQIVYYPDGAIIGGDLSSYNILPQPSQQFIEKYIEEYNKGNVITEVMVEYETKVIGYEVGFTGDIDVFGEVLKVNPKDNTINTMLIKDSWSREELQPVVDFIKEIASDNLDRVSGGIKDKAIEKLKWIEHNL